MTGKDEKKEVATRPPSPGTSQVNGGQYRPEDLDPELKNLAMARVLVDKMGSPSILNNRFVVRYGIYNALNHIPATRRKTRDAFTDIEDFYHPAEYEVLNRGNPTGYDCSLRLAVYREVAAQSVNIDGRYFEKIWAYLMKPKYVISGMNMGPYPMEEENKESLAGRFINWLRGGKKNEQPNNS